MTAAQTEASHKTANGNPSLLSIEDEVKHVPLTDIFVDPDWNNRSLANTLAESTASREDVEGTGIQGLAMGIFQDGQDEPIILRGTAGLYKKTNKPYALVAGFRRYEAINRLNADAHLVKLRSDEKKSVVPNSANGTIRAVVRNLSELEAIKLNLRENTQRNDMSTPDLVNGARKLKFLHQMDSVAIANTLGKSKQYVDLLLRVATLQPVILDHWRNGGDLTNHKGEKIQSGVEATVKDLDGVSKLDKDRQLEAYCTILADESRAGSGAPEKQPYKAAKKKIAGVATLLGTLARQIYGESGKAAFLKLSDKVAFIDVVEVLVKPPKKGFVARQVRGLADAAEAAFQAAVEGKPEEEEEADEDDATA
jgi:ParB-like chromosome segregation protein Spo0J